MKLIEKIAKERAIEIKAELEATGYRDLEAKFKSLGIPEVWKMGTKKDAMIILAMKKLSESKDSSEPTELEKAIVEEKKEKSLVVNVVSKTLEKADTKEEPLPIIIDTPVLDAVIDTDIRDEFKEVVETEESKKVSEEIAVIEKETEITNEEEEPILNESDIDLDEVEKEASGFEEISLPREVIERNLAIVEAHLIQAMPNQRILLIGKQNLYIDALLKLDEK